MSSRSCNPSSPSAWWLFALAAALVAASSVQMPDVSSVVRVSFFDKIAHFSLFGLLATLAARLRWVQAQRPFGIFTAVLLVSIFGATDEWHQQFTAGRSVELADWMVDSLGALIAVTLYARWSAYRRLLETPIRRPGKRDVENRSDPCVIALNGSRGSPASHRGFAPANRPA